jgi:formate dehydrogenase major subunit
MDPTTGSRRVPRGDWEDALELPAASCALSATACTKSLAGFGSAKGSNEEAYLFQKLVRTGFGSNNVDHCTRLCHALRRWRAAGRHRLRRGIEPGDGRDARPRW